MNTFNIGLDLDKRPAVPEWVTIRQGDMNGTTIAASIYDHGTLLTGSYDARVCFRLPDGEHYYRKDATFSAGVATVTIDEQEAASVIGNTFGYFEILSGSTVIASTADFGVRVLRSATDGMTPGETYDNAIQDAIDGLNDAVTALPDTVEGILTDHPEWTTTVQDGSVTLDKLATTLNRKLIKSRGFVPDDLTLTNANAAERNSVLFLKSTSGIANLPTTEKCALITIGNGRTSDANTNATSICVQLCVLILSPSSGTWQPRMWVRSRYGGSNNPWGDWRELLGTADGTVSADNLGSGVVTEAKVADEAITLDKLNSTLVRSLLVTKGYVSSSTDPIDANTVTRGTIYFVTSTATYSNLPAEAGSSAMGYLITFSAHTSSLAVGATGPAFQVFAEAPDQTAQTWTGRAWYRSRYGASNSTWSQWQRFATTDDVRQMIASVASDVSMFRKVGVLGDSFASGTMYVNGEYVTQDYEQAWPKNMARQHGIDVVRYSQSGWAAYDWIHASNENTNGMAQFNRDVANDNVCGLYIICFGINDASSTKQIGNTYGGMDYIGSSADVNVSDPTQNANTFWGQMSRIIATIQASAPNSKIVLTTIARESSETRVAFTEAIKAIATYWSVPCLYLYGDAFFTSDYWVNGFDGGHPTAPMYAGMAVAINRLLAQCIADNYSYFKTYTGV